MTTATKYKTYSKYKPSGIDWLGDIPTGWEVKRLKNIIEPLQSGGRESESINLDGGVLSIGGEHVGWNGEILLENPRYISREYYLQMNQGKIKENDVLLVKDGATIGKTALIGKSFLEDAAVNEHVFIIRANNKNTPKYLYYFIISKIGQEQIFLEMRGSAQPGLNSGFISKSFLFAPPKDEQKQITDFLDRETAKIDEMVAKKQKMMALLKEKRQALITHAVTKGLDPKAKMKPSGIDWLGDIPERWQALPLKRVVGIKITDGPHETPEILDEGVNFISAEAVKNEKINFDLRRGFISEELHKLYSKKCKPQKNDIFLIKSGATTGNIAIVEVDFEFSIWSPLALIRADEKKSQYIFLFYSLLSKLFHDQVEFSWSYGTQQNIGMGVIENLIITLPPYSLQKEIADYIDHESAKIDGMMKKVEMQIEKLREYRQALITSAVTGKIMIKNYE